MILLLDTSSLPYQHTHFQNLWEEKSKSEDIRERLFTLLFTDLKLDLLQSIDFIILLNLDFTNLDFNSITLFDVDSYIRRTGSIDPEEYKRLLQTLRIFNYQDLGLCLNDLDEQKLIDKKLFNIWHNPLMELIKDQEVMFFGEWISQYSILLTEHLQKTKLFKKNFFSFEKRADNGFYEVVESREKYIKYYKSFYINRISESKNSDYYKYGSDKNYFFFWDPFKNVALSDTESRKRFYYKNRSQGNPEELNKIIFVGDNNFYIEKFLKEIPTNQENYYWQDCSDNNFKLKPEMDGLVFKSVHRLTQSKIIELMSEISVSEYKSKPVFLLADDSNSIPPNNDFILVEVPSNEDCKMSFHILFFEMIRDKPFDDQESFDLERYLSYDLYSSGNLDNFFDSLTTLAEMDKLLDDLLKNPRIKINLLHLDFWFDFINYYEAKLKPIENAKEKISADALENRAEKKPEYWIEFKLDLKSDVWRIENNLHVLVNKVSYSNSKGLGIMDYLVNECRYPKTISAKELIRIINKRFTKKTKKAPYADPVQTIKASIRYDLKKIDSKILHLINQFQLEEECYYDPKVDFDIKFTREKDSKVSK